MKKALIISSTRGILTIIFIALFFSCSSHTDEEKNIPDEANSLTQKEKIALSVKADFVGSTRCKSCHVREFDSWKHTLHSKFVQNAEKLTVVADFERNNTLITKIPRKAPRLAGKNITSTMFQKDGKFYVNTIGPDWKLHDYEISHVIGINRHQNYITKFPNGSLHVLPVEWNIKEMAWKDRSGKERHYPGDGGYWSDTESIWQYKCGSCHATGMKINYNKASDTFRTTWVDLGIGCESCHGPGSQHLNAAKVLFEGEEDTIVNPSKLPPKLRADVCGQCHNWGVSTTKVTNRKKGFPERYSFPYGYEVGRPLYLYYLEGPEDGKKHHQQYNEWKESTHSEAGIICSTCHAVHQEGAHRSPNKAQTKLPADMLCKSCHTSLERKAAHKIHTFGSCIACHMLKTKGFEHSHTFKFVSPEESLRAGGVDKKLNSCSGCHHHKDDKLSGLIEFLDAIKKDDMPLPYGVHKY